MNTLSFSSEAPAGSGIWPDGAAFVEDRFRPVGDAGISVLDWGFTRSDVCYDVVHVKDGTFFRLDDHIHRFQASMAGLRMRIPHDTVAITDILMTCVRLTGLRDSYVALVCTRGTPPPGPRGSLSAFRNRFIAYALPWIDVLSEEIQQRGGHMIIARTPRIPAECVDPTIKNYNRGDMTRAMFEAEDAGVDSAIMLDHEGFVTEGPGFNIFAARDGELVTPDRGALEGITRKATLELCADIGIPAREGRLRAEDLHEADEVFAVTTAGGIMPVTRIDKRILSNDRPGPIASRLKALYWQRHTEGWHATPVDYGDSA